MCGGWARRCFGGELALALLALLAQPAHADAGAADAHAEADPHTPLPSPGAEGSAAAYVASLTDARELAYEGVLQVYDRHMAAHRLDVTAAIERCLFLEHASNGGEMGEPHFARAAELVAPCAEQLVEVHGSTGPARLFRIQRLYGTEAIEFGKETLKLSVDWYGETRPRFEAHMAWAYFNTEEPERAFGYASAAMVRGGDGLTEDEDVGPILAAQHMQHGRRTQAVALLSAPAGIAHGHRRLSLLLELEAFPEALALIERMKAQDVYVGGTQHARALEGTGDIEGARRIYQEVASAQYGDPHARAQLFKLELKQGDRARTIDAYSALRDEGHAADPLGRYRLALTAAWPDSPWRARDLLGLLGLLAVFVGAALVPLLWITPVHYAGLLRRQRGTVVAALQGPWTLRHLWAVSWAVLLADVVAMYWFIPEELHNLFATHATEHTHSQASVAHYGVVSGLLTLLLVVGFVRPAPLHGAIRSGWSVGKTAGVVLVTLMALGMVRRLSVVALAAFGFEADDPLGTMLGSSEITTHQVIRAVAAVHGTWPMLLSFALVVPIVEEVAFRGVFLGAASRHLPFAWANTVQATLFVIAHDHAPHYVALFVLALVAGELRRRSGGLGPAIALHAANNLFACLAILATTH